MVNAVDLRVCVPFSLREKAGMRGDKNNFFSSFKFPSPNPLPLERA
jgi:hypothetical protein